MSTQAPVALEQHVAETIAALARTLYPHDALSGEVYARVSDAEVVDFDAADPAGE